MFDCILFREHLNLFLTDRTEVHRIFKYILPFPLNFRIRFVGVFLPKFKTCN
jgi:hypothetical protein